MEKGLGAANNVLEKTSFNPAIEPVAANAPQAESDRPKPTLEREPVKKIALSVNSEGKDNEGGGSGSGDGNAAKRIVIQKLVLYADIKKLKDLQYLYEVAKEIEDFAIANGSEETADDPDAVPTMT